MDEQQLIGDILDKLYGLKRKKKMKKLKILKLKLIIFVKI